MERSIQYVTLDVSRTNSEWSPKEDIKRRLIWTDKETLALLKLMQKQSLTNPSLSHSQLSELLIKPLRYMGVNRTIHQIRSKLKNLRKSYLQCKKHGCTPVALKECPYYDTLHKIYENTISKELLDSETENSQESINKFVWTENEMQKMLSIIEELNLAHEISLKSFSLGALRLISKAMKCNGFDRNVEHIKIALLSLKDSYIECKKSILQGDVPKECPYFEDLDEIWGSDEISELNVISNNVGTVQTENDNKVGKGKNEFWSEEETIVLLISVNELGIASGAFHYTDFALTKLCEALQDSGYIRTKSQIKSRLENLKQSFINEKNANNIGRTLQRFPFYHLYESFFGPFFNGLNLTEQQEKDDQLVHPLDTLPGTDTSEKKRQIRSPAWSEEETILALALIQELNLVQEFKDRLTLDVVSKLVGPLTEHGFCRTASQIKIKLKNLRTSYQKCYQAGCTPQALAECPFYNRLHAIFQKSPQCKKLDTVRKLEPIDHSYVNMIDAPFDHSYVIGVPTKEKMSETLKKAKSAVKEGDKDRWLPVETIPDEDTSEIAEEYEALDKNTDYPEDENDSDTSDFEKMNGTELCKSYKTNCNETVNFIDEVSQGFAQEETVTDKEISVPAESNQTHKKEETVTVSKAFPSNDIKLITAKSNSALKRKYSFLSHEESLNRSKLSRRSDTESPFIDLLRHTDTVNDMSKGAESVYVKSMRAATIEVLTHEKWIQEQHHKWMEQQFEIQRKHDRDQRELLLNELKELRRVITIALLKRGTCKND